MVDQLARLPQFGGDLAAPTFGPMLRFVAGTEFAARRITGRLMRQALRR
ncbi:hypothetical protein [Streptomyces sp. NBC_00005]